MVINAFYWYFLVKFILKKIIDYANSETALNLRQSGSIFFVFVKKLCKVVVFVIRHADLCIGAVLEGNVSYGYNSSNSYPIALKLVEYDNYTETSKNTKNPDKIVKNADFIYRVCGKMQFSRKIMYSKKNVSIYK